VPLARIKNLVHAQLLLPMATKVIAQWSGAYHWARECRLRKARPCCIASTADVTACHSS